MLLLLLLLGREVKCINSTPHLGAQRPTTQETVRPVFRQDLARPFLLLLHRRETAAAALAEPTALAAAAAAAPAASGTSGPSRRCRPPPRDCRCRAGRADGGGGRRRCTASLWPSRRPRLPCRARPRPTAELAAAAAVKRAHAVKRASAWPTARGPLAEGAALADGRRRGARFPVRGFRESASVLGGHPASGCLRWLRLADGVCGGCPDCPERPLESRGADCAPTQGENRR
ncbi:unnamed protein product, partial [Prorocentrum cordatum]